MDLTTLCAEIDLPEPARTRVLVAMAETDPARWAPLLDGLYDSARWGETLAALEQALAPDPGHFRELGLMLTCCCGRTWQMYQALGLSREVYLATMGCFSRFVRECRAHRGTWAFDRAFWVPRQIACRLFRIGALEYELCDSGEIAVHIPSDADLDAAQESFRAARALLAEKFPAYAHAPMTCESWLLSPELPALLPKGARILAFGQCFTPDGTFATEDYREWVFRDSDSPLADLPEQTTLQRNLKAWLLAGKPFHGGRGILREPV